MKVPIGLGQFWNGDCLEMMADIPSGSVDMVLCDLPYGTTACAWDSVIPFDPLWREYWRVCKPNAAIVLTASQPFTTELIHSQIQYFKYQWVWSKPGPSNPQLAKIQPLKYHEDIAVFGKGKLPYYPQGLVVIPQKDQKVKMPSDSNLKHCVKKPYVQTHTNYPRSILNFPLQRGLHPTQKPVALFQYLIETYTQPGEVVLDNTAGSGTTAIAAENAYRQWICIERDPDYFTQAVARVLEHVS